MTLTKNAIGNLINRYKAVLKKCNLMNIFGTLAIAALTLAGSAGNAAADEFSPSKIKFNANIYTAMAQDFEGNTTGGQVKIDTGASDEWYAGGAGNINVFENKITMTYGTAYNIFGGFGDFSGNAYSNMAEISDGDIFFIHGGKSTDGNATDNTVKITGGNMKYASGGSSINGHAYSNKIEMSAGAILYDLYGGISYYGGSVGNKASISGFAKVDENAIGGRVEYEGDVSSNELTISANASVYRAFGGWTRAGDATSNKLTISDNATTSSIYAGYTKKGNANKNILIVQGGSISGNAYGGYSVDGNADANSVEITGNFTGPRSIYGGYSENGNATNNNVIYSGGKIEGNLYGGQPGGSGTSTGNTLVIKGKGKEVGGSVQYFQNYEFEIPEGFGASDTLLSVTGDIDFGSTGAEVTRISIAGNRNLNETFTLLSTTSGAIKNNLNTTSITQYGVNNDALVYDLSFDSSKTKLSAKITEVAELLGPDAVLSGNKTKSIWGKDASAANNKLTVTGPSTVTGNVRYFGNYNFVIPGTLNTGSPLWTVTGTVDLGTGAKVESVSIQGDRAVGDTFTLLSAGTITNPDGLTYNSTTIGTTPISITQKSTSDALVYDLSFDSSKMKLSAKITEVAELLGPDAVLSGNKDKSIWGKDASAANNKLTVTVPSTVTGNVRNFGNYNFVIPGTLNTGSPLWTVTGTVDLGTGAKVESVSIQGDRVVGDTFTLLSAGTITNPDGLTYNSTTIGTTPISITQKSTSDALVYDLSFDSSKTKLSAKITEVAELLGPDAVLSGNKTKSIWGKDASAANNKLTVTVPSTVTGNVRYFGSYKFEIPAVGFNAGGTLLNVTDTVYFGDDAKVDDISILGDRKVNDTFTLMSAKTIDGVLNYNGKEITSTTTNITQISGKDALVYDLYRDGNAFKTKITEVAELVDSDAQLSGAKYKSIWGKDASSTNNTLKVIGASTVNGNVKNFGSYKFEIPAVGFNAGGTLLNVTDTVYFGKDTIVDGISILGDRKVNDTFTLMSAKTIDGVLNYNGKEITSTTTNITQISGKDALVYDLYRDGNAFKTKITEVAELLGPDAVLSGNKDKSIWGKDASAANNKLTVTGTSTVTGNVRNFGNYNFVIPGTLNTGSPLWTVTGSVDLGTGAKVESISIQGDRAVGDTFTLLSSGTITNPDGLTYNSTTIGTTPISITQKSTSDALVYDLSFDSSKTKLSAKITEVAELLGPDAVLSGNKDKSIWGKDASAANNKLTVTGPSTVAGNVRYFGNYAFEIPTDFDAKAHLLNVTDTVYFGSNAKVDDISILGDRKVNDTFTLMSAKTIDGVLNYNGKEITSTTTNITQISGKDALVYDLYRDGNAFKTKITEVAELLGPDAVLSGNKDKSIWGKDASAAKNKLTVTGPSTVTGNVRNFGNYNFVIPGSLKDGGTLLSVTGTIELGTGAKVESVSILGDRKVNDTFTLLKSTNAMTGTLSIAGTEITGDASFITAETVDNEYKYSFYFDNDTTRTMLFAKVFEVLGKGRDFGKKLGGELGRMFDKAFASGEVKPSFADDYSKPAGVRFISRAINKDYGNGSSEAVKTVASVAQAAAIAAVPQMAVGAILAGAGAIGQRTTIGQPAGSLQSVAADNASGLNGGDELSGLSAGGGYDKSGFAMWIMPLWQSNNSFGLKADAFEMDSHASIGGIAIGADYTFEQALRFGLTFNIGGGYAEGSGDLAKTKNNMNFWGVGAYAGWMFDNFGLTADVNYTSTHNNIRQEVAPSFRMQDMESEIMASAISAGLRAEYKFNTDALDIIPHVGVRYIHLATYGHDVESAGQTVLEAKTTRQNIWTFPVGVQFTKRFDMDNGWYVRPSLDLNVTPAAGDIDVKQDVRFTGVTASASPETQTMDWVSYGGQAGLEFGNGNMKLGLNYNLQVGAHTTNHGVFGTFRYEF